ncbi:MAG: hypothetical protein ACJA0Z_004319 [Halioglobus sp.]|jgi:hypothetical protein
MSLLAQTVPARVREFGHINVQENNDAVDNQHMTLLDKYYPQPPPATISHSLVYTPRAAKAETTADRSHCRLILLYERTRSTQTP